MNTCINCGLETKNPKYCGSSCAAKVNNRIRAEKQRQEKPNTKTCKNCGILILDKNTYCSIDCQHKFQNSYRKEQLLAGLFSDKEIRTSKNSWLRNLLIELLGEKCSECGIGPIYNGKPLTLEVDHINGKSSNNVLSNLRFLCPNCHSQTDTYKAKNIKSDRITRYK
jgi:hypothetical protein